MTTQSFRHVARPVRLPLSALALALAASTAAAQEPPREEATTLDRIEVTGTRITRRHGNGQPVFVIDRQNIDLRAVTVGEFLQRTPAIAGAATNPQVNNGGGAGAATVDLRGLGVNRSLVLVDGKRWIGTISNANGAVDVNSIPMALIERVEVLKDGASAIYGSDAIGGVVNFILRKDFDGLEASAYYGVSSRGDAQTERYDAVYGLVGDKGRLMLGAATTRKAPSAPPTAPIPASPISSTRARRASAAPAAS